MDGTAGPEVLRMLDTRRNLMGELADGAYEQPELAERLDASRSTVYRGITELQSLHLVEYGGDGYRLTVPGRYLYERYRSFLADVTPAMDAAELLAVLPHDAEVGQAMVRDAEVTTADPPNTAAPGRRMRSLMSSASRVWGLGMTESQTDARDVHRELLATETPMDFVFEASFLDHLLSTDVGERLLEAEAVSLATVETLPYGLFVVDHDDGRTAVLLVYDGESRLRGGLFNDSETACEWAMATFERFRERASPVET